MSEIPIEHKDKLMLLLLVTIVPIVNTVLILYFGTIGLLTAVIISIALGLALIFYWDIKYGSGEPWF